MTEKNEALIEEARRAAPGDDATELAVMVHRLTDALEAATRERAAVPDAATEIERYIDAAEGNRIRMVHAQNDAEQFEAERDAALAAIARVRAVCVEAEATKNRNRAWTKRLGYASTSTHDPVPGLKEVLAALDGAPEPEPTNADAVLVQVRRYLERFNPGGTHAQNAMAQALENILDGAQVAWSPSDDERLPVEGEKR